MIRLPRLLVIALPIVFLPLVLPGGIAHASGGNNLVQTVALHRQACTASAAGPMPGLLASHSTIKVAAISTRTASRSALASQLVRRDPAIACL